MAECLGQIVPNGSASVKKTKTKQKNVHQMFWCLHEGLQRLLCRMWIVIVLLETGGKLQGKPFPSEGLMISEKRKLSIYPVSVIGAGMSGSLEER